MNAEAALVLAILWVIAGWYVIVARKSKVFQNLEFFYATDFRKFSMLATCLCLIFWPIAPLVLLVMSYLLKKLYLDRYPSDKK